MVARTILYSPSSPRYEAGTGPPAASWGKTLTGWVIEAMEEELAREDAEETKQKWEESEHLSEQLTPIIAAGTKGHTNAAHDIPRTRHERLDILAPIRPQEKRD